MLNKLIPFFIIGFIVGGYAVYSSDVLLGAPDVTFEVSLEPVEDDLFELGTTSPSSLRWHRIHTGTGTSTSANGWDISSGCYAINSVCIGGDSSVFAWTPDTTYGENANSTSTPIWVQENIYASSTIYTSNDVVYDGGKSVSDNNDFFNGSFIESFNATSSSDGSTVQVNLANASDYDGGLTARFSSGYVRIDTPTSTPLTAGSDTSPTENFIYITEANPVLQVSTTDWPSEEHIRISYGLVQSPASVQAFGGCYICQNWNDHSQDTNEQGHQQHIGERLRYLGAIYHDGIDGNGDGGTYIKRTDGSPDNVYIAHTAGTIMQMHRHTAIAKDTSGTDKFLVVNHATTPYDDGQDLYNYLTDSDGDSMEGKYYNLVLWGVANKTGEFTPLMVNLPSCSYNSLPTAEADNFGCDNFTMPREFNRESSTGFLIARLTFKHTIGTQDLELQSTVDLRGRDPLSASGGAAASAVEFADNVFRVFDETDTTKKMAFDVGALISSATTRTYTAPNKNGTLALLSDIVSAFAWTPAITYNENTNSTSTPIWLKDTLYASSTSYFSATSTFYSDVIVGNQLTVGTTTHHFEHVFDVVSNTNGSSKVLAHLRWLSPTPANGDRMDILFSMSNSAGQETEFSRIDTLIEDVTDGSEDGAVTIDVINDGTLEQAVVFAHDEIIMNDAGSDRNFIVKDAGSNSVFNIKGNTGFVGISTTTPGSIFSVDGVTNFTTSTSTFSSTGGLDLSSGCYAINNTCLPSQADILNEFAWTPAITYNENTNSTSTPIWLQDSVYASSTLHVTDTATFFDKVGIATSSPYAQLSIENQAGVVPFVIGSSTATDFFVNEVGQVGIGKNAIKENTVTSRRCLACIFETISTSSANTFQTMYVDKTYTPPSSSAATLQGAARFNIRSLGATGFAIGTLRNFLGVSDHDDTGTLTNLRGVDEILSNNSSGTVSNAEAFRGTINNTSTGEITRAEMFTAGAPVNSGGGTFTDYFAFYSENPTVATNNYAFVSEGGTSIFNDSGVSSSDFRVESDTDTHLFFLDSSANYIGISSSTPSALFTIDKSVDDELLSVYGSTNNNFIVDLYNAGGAAKGLRIRGGNTGSDAELLQIDSADGATNYLTVTDGNSSFDNGNLGVGVAIGDLVDDTLDIDGEVRTRSQLLTIANSGDSNPALATLTPTHSFVEIWCQDTLGGCEVTMSESTADDGQIVVITILAQASGTTFFTDTSGVSEMAGNFGMGAYDSLSFIYMEDRWVETSRSNN